MGTIVSWLHMDRQIKKNKKGILEPNRFLIFNGASNLSSIVNRNLLELKSLAKRDNDYIFKSF